MRQETAVRSWAFPCLLVAVLSPALSVGCTGGHSFSVPPGPQAFQPQPTAMIPQGSDLPARAAKLDADNQQLHALLAQQQQQAAQLQSALQQSQQQAAALRSEVEHERSSGPSAKGGKGLAASSAAYSGPPLPLVNINGAEVVRDGAVVRIRISTGQLFSAGKADLKPGVDGVLDQVAKALSSDYAGHMIGIEGYTDNDPITKSKWHSNHELAVSRSVAVFQALKQKGVSEKHLFVAGYGPNRPLTEDNTKAGKAQNRRVEIVIHPETAG